MPHVGPEARTEIAHEAEEATVSVILPTYQRADCVGRTIESVLQQSHRATELIIVDDGSTDETAAVVDSFQDPRLEYIQLPENKGANYARNVGIEASNGEFIAFIDSDDIWRPQKLKRQLERIQRAETNSGTEPALGAVYTDFWQIKESGRELAHQTMERHEGDIQPQLLVGNGGFVTTSVLFVRRECLTAVGGFDEHLPRLQEWELCLRLAAEYDFGYVPEPLAYKHKVFDEMSISSDEAALVEALEYVLAKHADTFAEYPQRRALHEHRLGRLYLSDGRPAMGRRWLLRAARTFPRPAYLAAVFVGLLGPKMYHYCHAFYTRFLPF